MESYHSLLLGIILVTTHLTEANIDGGKECVTLGYMCENCTASSLCYPREDGTLFKKDTEDCSLTLQTCSLSDGVCTLRHDPSCIKQADFDFKCNDVGVFPDPYNCTKYYVCMRGTVEGTFIRYPKSCSTGLWFDTLTLKCNRAAEGYCQPPVPNCTEAKKGAVRGNPSMYYFCVPSLTIDGQRVYVPEMHYCPGRFKYFKGDCYDTAVPFGVVNNTCTAVGSHYTPNCVEYNSCKEVGDVPNLRQCKMNQEYFDRASGYCYTYDCKVFLH